MFVCVCPSLNPNSTLAPTRIIGVPEHQVAIRGSTARFDCKVKSDPTLPIVVSWMKNDKPLHLGWR